MAMSPDPKIRFEIKASLATSNGVTVTIGPTRISICKPGLRGGQGDVIEIPVEEWDQMDKAVRRVIDAIGNARTQLT